MDKKGHCMKNLLKLKTTRSITAQSRPPLSAFCARPLAFIALAAAIGFSFAALSLTGCSKGGGSSSPTAVGESGNAEASGGAALSGGGKTGAFFNLLSSESYHMKVKTDIGGVEVISETFVKDGMMATSGDMGGLGQSYRSIYRDDRVYIIDDQAKTVMSIPAAKGSSPGETVRTPGMIVTSSGTARFNGKNLPYEEYSAKGSSVKVQLFLDGKKPAGMRTISSEGTIDMIILALDQKVPNNVFDIPAGYQKIGR